MKRTKVIRIYLDRAGQIDAHKLWLPFAKRIEKMIATSSVMRANATMLERFAPEIHDIEETAPGRLEISGAYFTSESVLSSPGFTVLGYVSKQAGKIVADVSFSANDGIQVGVKIQNKVFSVTAAYLIHKTAAPLFPAPIPAGWRSSGNMLAWSLPALAGIIPARALVSGVYAGLKGFIVRNPQKRPFTVSAAAGSWDCTAEKTAFYGLSGGSLGFSAPAGSFGEVSVSLMLSDISETPTFPDTGGGGSTGPNYTVDINGDGAINSADDQDGDGDTDAADQAIFDAANTGGGGGTGNYTRDINGDGAVNSADDQDGDGDTDITDSVIFNGGVANPYSLDINGDGAINSADDQDGDGDTDAADQAVFDAANPPGPNYTVDINGDGTINATDDQDGDGDTDAVDQAISDAANGGGGGTGNYTRDINGDGVINASDDQDGDGDTDNRDQFLFDSAQP